MDIDVDKFMNVTSVMVALNILYKAGKSAWSAGRHAGHWWRSKDELISDILLWTPSYGRAKAGRPAWTYIQQLCADIGFILEDLPGAMDD